MKTTQWLDPTPIEIPSALRNAVGGHPLVATTLARRGILNLKAARAFLDPAAYSQAAPEDLPDMQRAVEHLRETISQRDRIVVWGDFDADGQTATALLLQVLLALGADVSFYVPTRQEGHGLHEPGLERLIANGARLILTCDTGVTAHAAAVSARSSGVDLIITDHHVPSDTLPPAIAVVNPHRLPADHPLLHLPGVGVAYQLARALDPALADRALDLVALGTVADVATLRGDTRYLVQRGLEALRRTERPGLRAIYEAAALRPEGITEEHIGFVLGPRLNALGRLADASHGVELLTTADRVRARTLATEVEGLNARRQWLTKQVTDAALAQIDEQPGLLRDHAALVLSHPTWPGGVAGIVAGRLAERYAKPTFLIAAPLGELARGSGRSVPKVDLIAALTDCAPLLHSFGGHRGAAGFSIDPERIPELRAALSRAVTARTEALPEQALTIDAYVELPDLTLELVAQLSRLAPFGPGNPHLTLAVRDLSILGEATIGRTGEHRRLTVQDPRDQTQKVFWWQGADRPLPRGRFDLALNLRASDFRGVAEVQAEWLAARELEPRAAIEVSAPPPIEVQDLRGATNPEATLRAAHAEDDIQVWAEGPNSVGLEARTRRQLIPGRRLVIWTLPPGPRELQGALQLVQPEEVLLFAQDPGMDEPTAFLQRLAGIVKSVLHRRGRRVDPEELAAATAQRVSTVRAGLDWLAAQGQIEILELRAGDLHLAAGMGAPDPMQAEGSRTQLDLLLAETAAYRAYFLHAPAAALVKSQHSEAD